MAALSEWLQIMLAEIARKREDLERAREEEVKRDTEADAKSSTPLNPRKQPAPHNAQSKEPV